MEETVALKHSFVTEVILKHATATIRSSLLPLGKGLKRRLMVR